MKIREEDGWPLQLVVQGSNAVKVCGGGTVSKKPLVDGNLPKNELRG